MRTGSLAFGAAVAVLASTGLGHRLLAARINTLLSEYLQPRQPLKSLPVKIGSWTGRDLPLDKEIRRIAGDDEFINREYRDAASGRAASVYVGYIGRPRSRMGHRPDVCYPTHGYREISRQATEISIQGLGTVPALLYEYAPPAMGGAPQLVLATYAINGQWVNDPGVANAYNVRGPALFSRQLAYVVRIQVTLQSLGDRASDLALLSGFAAQLVTDVRNQLPQ